MTLFRRISTAALLLCAIVVVLGAYVRLSDAGLGCPDWPGCYGQLTVPDEHHETLAAAENFPERPLEAAKAWKEMLHRYLASLLGLLILAMALLSALRRDQDLPRRLPWVLVGLVIFQGILGMWTVTWLLKPAVVTAHLLGGMSTFALLLWLRLSLPRKTAGPVSPAVPVPSGLRRYAGLALVLVAVQIFLGGWTSTNYAALACPDFPACQNQWWPVHDVSESFRLWRGLGVNYEYGVLDNRQRMTVHFVHRLGAIVVSLALLLLSLHLWRQRWRGWSMAILAALSLQLLIGISTVLLQLPLWLATAHNAGAALLLAALVSLNHAAWRKPTP